MFDFAVVKSIIYTECKDSFLLLFASAEQFLTNYVSLLYHQPLQAYCCHSL